MGIVINCKQISEKILAELSRDVSFMKDKGIIPGLAVIMVGGDTASGIYVRNKRITCDKVGLYSEEHKLPENTSQDELLRLINNLNLNPKIHGILVQLPLPKHINSFSIIEAILPYKDVDAFSAVNAGHIMIGQALLSPCTPSGIIEILKHENIDIEGKRCVIAGRSNIVGRPLAMMMMQENGTVTICHSKTKNQSEIFSEADILVSAVGKPKFITCNMVKKGAVVIDVGINRGGDGKICGDVDTASVVDKVSYITPVPGGVGPMTIAMLMKNTVKAAEAQEGYLDMHI